jgi:hypothetical protein
MKTLPRTARVLLAAIAAATLAACSSMPATRTDYLTGRAALNFNEDGSAGRYRAPLAIDPARMTLIDVQWRAEATFSDDERAALTATLQKALQDAAAAAPAQPQGRPIVVRAAITRVETVSPAANVATTLLLFVPLDRGGAAVEIEALDAETRSPLAALTYAHYAPLTEFGARFVRLAPAEVALKKAATEFKLLLADPKAAQPLPAAAATSPR